MSAYNSKSSSLSSTPVPQSKLFRTSSGAVVSGVCSGLQACGKGNVVGWRVLFVISGYFIVGIFVYVCMALFIPKSTPEQEQSLLNQGVDGDTQVSNLDKIQVEMEKIQSMKESGVINEEEYSSLRKKILGI